ncbi:hypothetical protein ITP31_003939 [Salmonella enterica]|nr:hypothetical protein [Salmonella enterica]QFP93053.1 hypothetical protein [Serratia phage PCH45]
MAFTTQALYIEQVIQLARSVIIKLDSAAEVMNKYLVSIGKTVDANDPKSWIYYRHLAGLYHPTDKVMKITSLDTLEEIEFTYDNLKYHRATFNAYRSKGDFYKSLVALYPEQVDLINGILNPVDINIAINVPNFTVLALDTNLVNANETNLVDELQKYVTGFSDSWYNHNYCYLFDEYPAIFLNTLYTTLPSAILNIRKNNIRTEYVHDYHLWAYLGSHQRIDKYRDYLTREQAMWLYRNISYLEAHPGWNHSFTELIEWLLTKRTIPITSFELTHNLEKLGETISPSTEIVKRPLNKYAYSSAGLKKETIEATLNKETSLAPANKDYYAEQIVAVPEKFKLSPFSSLETKVLESDMVDRSDAQPVHFINTVFNEWMYLASTGRYTANITLTNPYTSEVLSMTAKEAVIVWLYCLHRMLDVEIDVVPTFLAHDVMRPISPRYTELRDMSPRMYVSEEMILAVMDEFVPQGQIISVEKFTEVVTNIHNAVGAMRYLYATQESFHIRGHLENVVKRMFMEHRCTFTEGITYYSDFFQLKGWKMDKMTNIQYQDFANQIFVQSTGLDLKNINSVRAIQQAMIQLMQQLSSYSIQFLSRITDSSATVLDFPVIRVGDVDNSSTIEARHKLRTEVLRVYGKGHSAKVWDVGHGVQLNDDRIKVESGLLATYPITAGFTSRSQVVTTRRLKLPLARINLKRAPGIADTIDNRKIDGVWLYDIEEAGGVPIEDPIENKALNDFWPDPFEEAGLNVDEHALDGIRAYPAFGTLEQTFQDESLSGFGLND